MSYLIESTDEKGDILVNGGNDSRTQGGKECLIRQYTSGVYYPGLSSFP